MLISRLQDKSPDYDGELWRDYWALYEGGRGFRKRVRNFLPMNPLEPAEVYAQRTREACYRSYLGTIVDYFGALLFTTDLTYTPEGKETSPEWSTVITEDSDGKGTNLVQFVRARLIESMVKGRGFWRLDFPANYGTGESKADADKAGATDVRLRSVQREDILDFEVDDRGKLVWVIVYESTTPRAQPDEERGGVTLHRWWVLDRESSRMFEAAVKKGERLNAELDLKPAVEHAHGLGEVPLVCIDPGAGLWVANRLESAQLEHFRLTSANNWSMRKTCYAMPVFSVGDPEDFRPNRMGSGYYLSIGVDESMEWTAPPAHHLAVVRDEILSQKDEIFRLVTQMSLGIDNNAAAVGRSAESKTVDAEAIQVVLRAYGEMVREGMHNTLRMLSRVRGEDDDWTVEGLDKFDTLPADVLVELLEKVIDFKIPSDTFTSEVMTRTAHAMLPGLDKPTRDAIGKEVAEGVPEMAKQNDVEHMMKAFHDIDRGDERKPAAKDDAA